METVLRFPPLYDRVSVVLAWPEIGFPESIVELPLPDRATVERETVSIWDAPIEVRRPPVSLDHRVGEYPAEDVAVETGRIVARPRVLTRGLDAAVALTRLTAVGAALALEIVSVARGDRARAANAIAFPAVPLTTDDPENQRVRAGASVAVLHDHEAVWLRSRSGSSAGGDDALHSTTLHSGATVQERRSTGAPSAIEPLYCIPRGGVRACSRRFGANPAPGRKGALKGHFSPQTERRRRAGLLWTGAIDRKASSLPGEEPLASVQAPASVEFGLLIDGSTDACIDTRVPVVVLSWERSQISA